MRIFFIPLLFLLLSLYIHSSETKLSQLSLNALIQKVKQSKGDQRRQAMNALKKKLRSANKQTRAKVIAALRQRFVHQHTTIAPAKTPTPKTPSTVKTSLPLPQTPTTSPTTTPSPSRPPINTPNIPQQGAGATPAAPRPQTPVHTPVHTPVQTPRTTPVQQPHFTPPRGGRP